jgi:hypothetical protein
MSNPKAGDYKVELTVPPNVSFHFGLATLPSKDIGQTIHDALANVSPGTGSPGAGIALLTSGDPKGKGKGKAVIRPFDIAELAAAGVRAIQEGRVRVTKRRRVDVIVPAATDGALEVQDFSEASASTDLTTDPSSSTPAALGAASEVLAAAVPTTGPIAGTPRFRFRVGTWNVFHGTLNGRDPGQQTAIDRIRTMIRLGARRRVAIMAFQEVQQDLFADLRNRAGGSGI